MLKGKVVVVTGASRGIGKAIANLFQSNGAEVICASKNSNIQCDVSDPKSVKSLFQHVSSKYGKLDVLVSNAGILNDALLGMVTKEQIDNVFGTNTYGVIYCAQYASRLMKRTGGGSIINISSIIGTNGNVGQTVYSASKSAVIGITKSLAKELAPIRVNAIAPGFIETDMAKSIGEKKFKERVDSIKLGRIGQPEEVAKVALFLASDMSSYVTGQIIGVDGGMLI